jgi:cytochrome c oxidase subunit 1
MASDHHAHHAGHGHGHGGHDHHDHGGHDHELSFIRKYVFSVDHKVIGIQYGITSLLFLMLGFIFLMIMRWQLAYPGTSVPLLGRAIVGEEYNMLGAMHGTIMVFFGIVPLLDLAAFGNFVMPLQIGTIDMAFPKLNMMSYWFFFISCVLMMYSFFVGTGPVQTGWTMYSPLATTTSMGVTSVWSHGQYLVAHGDGVQHLRLAARLGQLHRHDHQPAHQGHGDG